VDDETTTESYTPLLWTELRPDEDFNGPSATASVMVNGAHRVSVPASGTSLEWLRAMLEPGDIAVVRYHASGRKGMVGQVVYEEPADEFADEPDAMGDPFAYHVRAAAFGGDPLPPPPEPANSAPYDASAELARGQHVVMMRLLDTNTRLVERVLRTADVAINSKDATVAHANAIEDLTSELNDAHERGEGIAGRLAAMEEQHAKLLGEKLRRAARDEAIAQAEGATEGADEAPGWVDAVVEAVISKVMPDFIEGIIS